VEVTRGDLDRAVSALREGLFSCRRGQAASSR